MAKYTEHGKCNGFGLVPVAAQIQAGIVGNKLY